MSEHNRWNPAAGVVVLPTYRDKVQGLTMSQVKAARTVDHMGVMKPVMRGGAMGLGIPSCARITPRPPEKDIVPTRPIYKHPTPGSGGARQRKPRKQNRCCINHIPTAREYDQKLHDKKWAKLKALIYRFLKFGKGEAEYLKAAAEFCMLWAEEQVKIHNYVKNVRLMLARTH